MNEKYYQLFVGDKGLLGVALSYMNKPDTFIYDDGIITYSGNCIIDEKNKLLALKVNAMGGTERIPYMGASALTDDRFPTVGNITGGMATAVGPDGVPISGSVSGEVNVENVGEGKHLGVVTVSKESEENPDQNMAVRFPKLTLVDEKYRDYVRPAYDESITLQQFTEGYRLFAASQMKLYYSPEIVRRFCDISSEDLSFVKDYTEVFGK